MTVEEWLGNNQLSIDIFNKKYRQNNETFDQWLDRVSNGNEALKKRILEKKFMFAGRTLTNRGIDGGGSYSNCYSIGFVEDSLESIMDVAKDLALTFKSQGGQGLSLSKIRPKGSSIRGLYKSDGAIPFMEIFNMVTGSISQGNSRRGALIMTIDAWHKDAEEFISVKSDKNKINNANLSIEIDDEFMSVVENDLKCKTETVIHRTFRVGNGDEIEYDVIPIRIYNKICENAWRSAEPGVIYTKRFRNYNIMQYDDKYEIQTSNPCVTGDTTILTDAGYKRIDSLVGKKVNIWNGFEWSEVEPELTATEQEIYHIKFSDGCELKCTPYHKFILADGQRIEARELKKGTKLARFLMPVINGTKELDHAYTQGFFSGDGYIRTETSSAYVDLYHEKRNIQLDVLGTRSSCDRIKRDTVRISVDFKDKKFVPDASYSVKSRLEWLAGMVDSDGCSTKDGSIQISSIDKEFLMNIKFMLNTLGIKPVVSIMKREENKLMPDQKGGKKEYHCKTSYRLSISGWYVGMLNILGFKTQRVRHDIIPDRQCKRFIYVTSIENTGKLSDVYCFTEYKNHSGIFNGVMTAQCGEQPLPKHGACNLASINLSEYVVNEYSDDAYFDFDSMKQDIIDVYIPAMDDIIDENKDRHALKEQKDMAHNYRNIGLGIMGLADALCRLGIVYGSEECVSFVNETSHAMFVSSVEASTRLASEKGAFPCYDERVWDSEIMKNAFDEETLSYMKKNKKLRNCSLLSVAPTGSISTMLNISGGIEPFFALSYKRRTKNLNEEYDVNVKEVDNFFNKTNNTELPKTFVTSMQIDWKSRIDVQAAMQNFCDTAISSTVNLPMETTVDEVKRLYIYAWRNGLKGITIYREGSREPILSTGSTNTETDATEQCTCNKAQKRPKKLDADFYTTRVNGQNFFVMVGKLNDKPYEVFAIKAVKAVEEHSGKLIKNAKMDYAFKSEHIDIEHITQDNLSQEELDSSLYISMLLRHNVPVREIIKTARKTSKSIASFTAAICRILSKYDKEHETSENCPECGGKLTRTGGCMQCNECGYSKCS